jgi:hypothetical protein
MTPTTRRYPRTLDEAFHGADYARASDLPSHVIGWGGCMRSKAARIPRPLTLTWRQRLTRWARRVLRA